MGTADRDYSKEGRTSPGFFDQLTPAVRWLLIVNIGIYVLDLFLDKRIREFGAFQIQDAVLEGKVWEFFTFQFLHAHLAHLLFNCIGLFFFGPWMERWWGTRKFWVFYLLSGAGGAAFFTFLTFVGLLPNVLGESLVGASAGIYGILIGIAVTAPQLRVRLLFPPVELSMRTMALLVIAIAAGSVLLKLGGNEGGEAGHLGGALVGFLLVRFPVLLAWAGPRRDDFDQPRRGGKRVEPKLRPRSVVDLHQSNEVDKILDKISNDGFQSLTDEERETLHRASQSKVK